MKSTMVHRNPCGSLVGVWAAFLLLGSSAFAQDESTPLDESGAQGAAAPEETPEAEPAPEAEAAPDDAVGTDTGMEPETAGASAEANLGMDATADTEESAEDHGEEPGSFVLGLEVGAIYPQVFTKLGTHVALGLEVGYRLPFLGGRLEPFLSGGYSPPTRSFTEEPYHAKVTQHEGNAALGVRFRFLPMTSNFNLNLGAGMRLFFLRSLSNGSRQDPSGDSPKFAEFKEESLQVGAFVVLGGELFVGPGTFLLDLDFGWSKLPHKITGDESTGNLSVTLGYRLML